MIKLDKIEKVYPTGKIKNYVLRGITCEIAQGEFVSIMGPSGSGKSTLLHILGMLDEPTGGEYHFMNEPVHRFTEKRKTEIHKEFIGFVFQSYHLIDELTVYENIETPLLYKKFNSRDRQSMVCDTLDRFNIVGKKDLFPSQLSGGQQQLVGIARAVVTSPKIILADEPTGNLNSMQGQKIMDLFRKLNQEGTTVIQVTHSEKNASYGSRIINLLDGWIQIEE